MAVPDLVDVPEDEAITLLGDAGLVPGARTEASDETIVAGNVISSDPVAAAEVAPDSAVAYVVSTGPATVAVPDLVDVPEDEAITLLGDAGLVPGARTEASDETIVAGNVISSDPVAAAEVAPDSAVAYVVSTGPATVAVPDLVDVPEDEAITLLGDAGLVPGARTEASDETIVAGNVISSDPVAAAEVAPDSAVAYVVSTGPATVAVPDLVDVPEDEAITLLGDAGLVPGARTEASDETIVAGNVISSDPVAAAEVAPDSAVAYVVSTGPATVAVPDLVDVPEDEAITLLGDAGLVPGARTEASDETIVAGNVISSDPVAAAEVAPDSAVAYVVSTGPATVAVPDLVDVPEDEAITLLGDAGLVPGARTEASDETIVAGNVISSDPVAAAEVAPDSAVAYVVSTGPATVAVPDLVDVPEDEAITLLGDAGLVPGARTEASDETIVAGNVISSDPVAAAEVAPDSAVAYVVSTGPATVAVPDLVDVPEDEAITLLGDAGLVPGARTEASDETIVAGNVISSDPVAAAEVAPDSAVAYVVSTGPATVAVPDLVDVPEDEAITLLGDAGLVPGARTEASDETIVAGNVISSDPVAAAEVAPDSAVAYVVSTGPATVAVPDLVDVPEDEAITLLGDAGLVPGARTEASDETIVAGNVISSDPVAAAEVAPDSAVAYVVSTGPATVAVPDLVDVPEDEAITLLGDAGLVPGARTEASDETIVAGNVISSDPVAAAEVAPDSAVAYVVSTGPATVAVPDLVDVPEDEAITLLGDAGLVPGARTEASDETIVAGNVISSDPVAAAEVAPDSAVAYVVSTGPATVAVPDLSGAAADAPDKLTAANLTGAPSDAFSDSVPAGQVISQDPAAGSSVDIGSSVSYVVSQGVVPEVAVPAVRNQPEPQAITTLEDAGLLVGEKIEQFNENVAAGDAIKTDPAVDTEVPTGAAVSLYVSKGSKLTTVPDVNRQPEADAIAAIETAGLTVGETKRPTNGNIPAGDAVKTEPAAGAEVDLRLRGHAVRQQWPQAGRRPRHHRPRQERRRHRHQRCRAQRRRGQPCRGCGAQEHHPRAGPGRLERGRQGFGGQLHRQRRAAAHDRAGREPPARSRRHRRHRDRRPDRRRDEATHQRQHPRR